MHSAGCQIHRFENNKINRLIDIILCLWHVYILPELAKIKSNENSAFEEEKKKKNDFLAGAKKPITAHVERFSSHAREVCEPATECQRHGYA